MVEHVDIADGERHEPKGITGSTSNDTYVSDGISTGTWSEPEPKGAIGALDRQRYIADGSNSGAWDYVRTGWGSYTDVSSGTQTFNTTPAILEIDGASQLTAYLPHEIRISGDLWNGTTDLMTPVRAGDAYLIRLELPIIAKGGAPLRLKIEFDIGGLSSPSNVINERDIVIDITSLPFAVSTTTAVFSLSTFVANGMQIFLSTDSNSVDIALPGILITKTHDGLD